MIYVTINLCPSPTEASLASDDQKVTSVMMRTFPSWSFHILEDTSCYVMVTFRQSFDGTVIQSNWATK